MKNKKIKFLLPLTLFLSFSTLISCGQKPFTGKVILDYGTYREENIDSITSLEESSYDSVTSMINHKDSFILVIYSMGCSCWDVDFAPVCTRYINETHADVHYICVNQFYNKDSLGLYLVPADMPSVALFSRGRLVVQSVYRRDDRDTFRNYDKFKSFMDSHVVLPKMYNISKSVLDSFLLNNKDFNLYVAKNSCPDCLRVNEKVLTSWSDSIPNTVSNPIYIFDIQKFNYKETDPNYWYDKDKGITTYQHLKDIYGLSETYNTTLGWENGMVPTFQNRTGEIINDMITVYNDTYDEASKKVKSYFTAERLEHMSFLKDSTIEPKVLNGLTIDNFSQEDYEKAYVNPIINLFLQTYIK